MNKVLFFLLALGANHVSQAQDTPRPEHPRPDMARQQWVSLNGKWEFGETDDDRDRSWLTNRPFPDTIVVPFCRESRLSGLSRTGFVKNVWYRKTVTVPSSWGDKAVRLHIDACDWKTEVFVNGRKTEHTGGQTPIAVDCGGNLAGQSLTIVVHAFDDTRSGLQALGKQCTELNSFGCLYTRTTGIWQSVWLEGVGKQAFVSAVSIHPDIKRGAFEVEINVHGKADLVRAKIQDSSKALLTSSAKVKKGVAHLKLKVRNPVLWQPGKPKLYTIQLSTVADGKVVDEVSTYAGLREVSVKGRAILINGKPVFQRLVLDQGFYPDGIWTAPTDQALKHDIELSMAAGFNGARLHQKVFEPRFLYWADKLGYIVWGEYPNWGLNYKDKRVDQPVLNEWAAILARDQNHPSIVGWCPFNETPSEAGSLQNKTVALTRSIDRSRPILDTSGYIHSLSVPQVMDTHDYDQNPSTFKTRYDSLLGPSNLPARYGRTVPSNVPFMVSEYGGIGWATEGGWGYGDGPKSLDEFYARFKGLSDALLDNPNMFGFCYTQLTDVEQEHNGVCFYDRRPKFDMSKLHTFLARPAAIEKRGSQPRTTIAKDWKVIVGSARDLSTPWAFTTATPTSNWTEPAFNASGWKQGFGGFGAKGGFEKDIKTPWSTPDIWLRKEFQSQSLVRTAIVIHYDNAAEVYINGQLAWKSEDKAWNDGYEMVELSPQVSRMVKPGRNVIAVHCHQDTGGQFIDLALLASDR